MRREEGGASDCRRAVCRSLLRFLLSFGGRRGRGGGRVQAGLCADVDGDVGVEGQVVPGDHLVLHRVHPVRLPGLTSLCQHVEPEDPEPGQILRHRGPGPA